MNRKGYTMVELITVIIVLAAIAIVVMPIMTGVIDTARKSAAQQSAYNYIREVNSTILQNKSGPNRMSDRTYTLEELTKYGVTVSGTMPSEGNVTVTDEKVSSYYLVVNGYTFTMGEVKKDTTAPTIADITPHDADMTDWVTSIEIAVAAHDDENGVGLQINAYSFDGGATWQESNKKTVFENGTYKIEVRDNAGNIATQDKIIAKISSSTPSITIKGSAEGSNYVTVSATVANSQVGIAKMEYTIDDGATWIADGKNTTHTFSGLKKQTQYNVRARVTSANGKTAISDSLTLSTKDILTPTYSISSGDWTQSKNLTITYPTIAEQTMIYSYSLDDGNTWIPASQIQGVTFTANGTIIAMVTDSTNTVYASSYTVNKIDTTAPVISGINGNSSTWTTSVTLSVIAADENGGSGLQANAYSFDGGAIWQSSNSKTFTANGTYQIAVRDNAGNISTNQVVVNKISTKAPTISLATNTVGSSDVVVTTTITTSEMGVDKIEYSSDNGATWTADGTNTTHTYGGLTKLTKYTLRAKITDKNGQYAFSPQVDVTTKDVSAPTYAIDKTGWSQSKVVTITYPTMTGQTYLYSYSTDEGATWKPATQVQNVTFTTNGTIIAQVTDSGSNTVTGTTYTVSDVDSLAPAIASVTGDPLEWTTTTNIVINATDELGGSGLQTEPYSFDGGTTWQASNTKTVTSNGLYIVKVRDNVNNIASSQINITKISTTAPTITLAKSQVGSNFVITQVSVVDNEMGAQKIEYSIDNGTTWVTSDTSVNHTFGGLKANTAYTIAARVTSNNGKSATSNPVTITTTDITTPTYEISSTDWADSKIVTITYPTIVGETLTYTYSLDEGTTWLAATQVQQVTFTSNGTIIARVTDNTNTITANTYAVDKIYYHDPILNGADPVLDVAMIPVSIANDGTVTKADTATEWYNYTNKEWANVVLVSSDVRSTYQSATAGTSIDTSKILAYYVWIPRYKYALFNPDGTAGTTASTIDVVFENKSTAKSAGTTVGTYLTHPGFTFGTTELNGIWVGKFELTGDTTTPTVLPNVTSLRNQNLSTLFNTTTKFKTDTYGLTSDSHMIMNKEWGAVAYITLSVYGKNSEVRINNYTSTGAAGGDTLTGCGASADNGAASTTCQIRYGSNVADYPQSTTGNISGIFDMSGGAWEQVMGTYNSTISSSGFSTLPDSKYYQSYTDLASSPFGDALKETHGWYGDYSSFVVSSYPWFGRGGSCTDEQYAGMFYYDYNNGNPLSRDSTRVVIAPGA